MKKLLTLILMVSMAVSVRAGPDDRSLLIKELVQIYGLEEMMNEAKAASLPPAEDAIRQIWAQVRQSAPELPDVVWTAIRDAALEVEQTIENSWNTEEAVAVWAAVYAKDLSTEELRQIREFLMTPLGQKQITASKLANSALQEHVTARVNTAVQEALQAYVARLQQILTEAASME